MCFVLLKRLRLKLCQDKVRPHAHLEYSKGHFVFDADDTISLWRATSLSNEGQISRRGKFINIAEIRYDPSMRGFQLDFPSVFISLPVDLLIDWDQESMRGLIRGTSDYVGSL